LRFSATRPSASPNRHAGVPGYSIRVTVGGRPVVRSASVTWVTTYLLNQSSRSAACPSGVHRAGWQRLVFESGAGRLPTTHSFGEYSDPTGGGHPVRTPDPQQQPVLLPRQQLDPDPAGGRRTRVVAGRTDRDRQATGLRPRGAHGAPGGLLPPCAIGLQCDLGRSRLRPRDRRDGTQCALLDDARLRVRYPHRAGRHRRFPG